MKIAMVFSVYNKRGGIQRAIVEITQRLLDAGHVVHMIASDVENADPRLITRHVPMLRPNNPLQMASYNLSSTLALKAWLSKERYDIVHAHGAATMRADVVTAQSCHRAWVVKSRQTLKPFTRPWIRKWANPQHPTIQFLERIQYQPTHYRQIIAVSEGIKRELQTFYPIPPGRITVIPNGANLAEFAPEHQQVYRSKIRDRHGLKPDDFVCLLVANEFARKGLAEILDALEALPIPKIKLLTVGKADPGPYLQQIAERGLSDRVIFANHSPAVHQYYAAADCFVFPTAYEAFSLATIEAAAAGLPIVCTRVNGTEELVTDEVNGIFVERTGVSIAQAVQKLYKSPQLRKELGAAARQTAEGYSWESVTTRTIQVYERVLDEKQQAASGA